MKNMQYLGDSVYAGVENGMLVLMTDNSSNPKNVIFLDEMVIQNLMTYIERMSAPTPAA